MDVVRQDIFLQIMLEGKNLPYLTGKILFSCLGFLEFGQFFLPLPIR